MICAYTKVGCIVRGPHCCDAGWYYRKNVVEMSVVLLWKRIKPAFVEKVFRFD